MKLRDLGERKIIERLGGFLDIGDDAAVIKNSGKGYLVMSTDLIQQKTHMPKEMTPEQIGKFIVSINVSDIAAMGAKPEAFLLSCGLPPEMEFEKFQKIIKAADKQCRKYGVKYAGGDTKQNPALTLAGFCIGTTNKPILRSGAKIGDIIAVTGTLGDASLGFDLLFRKIKSPLTKKALEPQPKVREGLLLREYANSMTDLSDGLSIGLYNIAEQSKVGMKIKLEDIPTSGTARKYADSLGLDFSEYSLFGGGDYQLLFTISKRDFDKIEKKTGAKAIGEIVKGRNVLIETKGKSTPLDKKGYEHFAP